MADFTEAQWAEFCRTRGEAAKTAEATAQPGRQRHEAGKMNKREASYAHFLQLRKQTGEIREWRFEAIRLKLAPNTTLTPDFQVILPDDSIEFHEVKGTTKRANGKSSPFVEDDAIIKVKIAAEMFQEFRFIVVWWDKSDGWKFRKHGNQ